MKKARCIATLFLIVLLCSALSSCFFFGPGKPWEEDMLRDTFFGTDYLAERGVADFPTPKLEGSYFDAEKNILYLNLSREEFDAYTDAIVDYLRQKDEFKSKGFQCGSDLTGVFLLLSRYPLLASLNVEEIPYITENERLFGFSTKELGEISYNGRQEVEDPYFVSLVWEPTTKESGATYTAVMEFPHFSRAEFEICYHGHDFESITYPVAGTVHTTTIRTCLRCGEKEREGYGYGDELKKFYWTVTEGTQYLVSGISKQEYRGDLVEIATKTPTEGKLKMIVNGKEIPAVKETEGTQVFAFIMPYGDINITIELAEPHEHTGEMHSGEEAHWYTYTCGCPSNEIAELHYDYDNDGLCDICAYMVGVRQYYSLMINAPEWLYEELKHTYYADEIVSVKLHMATDVGFLFFVNGEEITNYQCDSGLYWEFTFPMPACDTVIHFKTYDGFLPDVNYGTLIETYYRQNLDARFVHVRHYYGEFASGAIVAMLDTGGYDDFLWEEMIGDTIIHYSNGNRIVALCPNNKFYTLTEAFENGYLTAEDITAIAEMHNNQ